VISWDLGGFSHRQTLLDAPSQFFVAATDHQYLSPMAKEQELFKDDVRRTGTQRTGRQQQYRLRRV
jgi:hypothetical protein